MKTNPEIAKAIEAEIAAWDEMADRLDGWVKRTLGGGWSTHLNQPQINAANDCRRRAANLRLLLRSHS